MLDRLRKSSRVSMMSAVAAHPRFAQLYWKYRHATMLPLPHFVDNLALVKSVALGPRDWIVECGTWKGGMAAAMIEVTKGGARYAFLDSFEGLPPASSLDGQTALAWQADESGDWYFDNCRASRAEFDSVVMKPPPNEVEVQVFEGWFRSTLPEFAPRVIAVLRLDVDWFESTLECLEALFPLVRSGGVVILDDYGTWDGCNLAVHKYLSESHRPEHVRRTSSGRVAYIVKD